MTLVEIIGHQHLRILALEETVGGLQAENSRLAEQVVKLTPKKTELKGGALDEPKTPRFDPQSGEHGADRQVTSAQNA